MLIVLGIAGANQEGAARQALQEQGAADLLMHAHLSKLLGMCDVD